MNDIASQIAPILEQLEDAGNTGHEWHSKCDIKCDQREGGHSHFSTLARDICRGIIKVR